MSESSASDAGNRAVSGTGWHPLRRTWQVISRTAVKSWNDSIFGKAATAAFWQTLSLPPLLLGLLGMLGYVGGWFGPDTVSIIKQKIITFSGSIFSESVVDQLIEPTVSDMLARGRLEIVSLSFLLSLWAGSSAISTFVDSIVEAHDQQDARHPVWQRIFSLLLYVIFLIMAVFTLPLVALGPTLLGRALPEDWREVGSSLVDTFYYPAVGLLLLVGLTTLYKVALPKSLPWHRLLGGALVAGAAFLAASTGLRWYLSWVTATGYTYGALATPIAFLLFTFFLGAAVVLGAEFNATIQEFWPARATRIEQMRDWLAAQAAAESEDSSLPVTTLTWRLATGPIRQVTESAVGSRRTDPPSGDDTTMPCGDVDRAMPGDITAGNPTQDAPTQDARTPDAQTLDAQTLDSQSPLRRPS
ncbi:MAG: YihY/virulence factor BrkB family protein [Rhodococcus sp.]|nr:YihY/virulence factor BrkB family protein [Rhodococcus sp. (in: high G+C Gram-positive bacteria)]